MFGIRSSIKLTTKLYGPFHIIQKVGPLVYKLLLPDRVKIHPMFHVSQLKKHLGPTAVPSAHLPLINPDGTILLAPEKLLDRKLIPRVQGDISVPVMQWLIKWVNLPAESATWEDSAFIQQAFPDFQP